MKHLVEQETIFGEDDRWRYVPSADPCDKCRYYASLSLFRGDELHRLFLNLYVADLNTIYEPTHPNCKCMLRREGR